jgi:hypothetical protein
MTKRTRYFLVGAATILLVGLGTGLVAYYKGDLPMFGARTGPDELAYVPADATGLAYANVREIMNSEFRQKLREVLPSGNAKDEFFNQTGIDIERDIQSVVAATGTPGVPAQPPLVLIRGYFDEGRIEALIRQHNGTVEDYKGKRLMALPEARGESPYLTFPETGLAMFGTGDAVRRAIDTKAGGPNVTRNEALMKVVAQLDGAGNSAWAVGGMEAVTANPNVPAQIRDQLPGIEWVAASAHVNSGISGHILAQAKDDKAANDLRAVVNGALAAGRLVSGRNPQLDAFISSLQVSGSDRQLDLSFAVPSEVIQMLSQARAAASPAALPEPR